jgi:hypothetical protein
MDGECSTHGEFETHTHIRPVNLKRRNHVGDIDLDERIILKWIFRSIVRKVLHWVQNDAV